MNPEIKAEWVKRLREPGRKQGSGRLRTKNDDGTVRQCCLDILCEIAVEHNVISAPVNQPELYPGSKIEGYTVPSISRPSGTYTELSTLPDPVSEWAGLSSNNPIIGGTSATTLNDDLKMPFPKIAERIESDPDL